MRHFVDILGPFLLCTSIFLGVYSYVKFNKEKNNLKNTAGVKPRGLPTGFFKDKNRGNLFYYWKKSNRPQSIFILCAILFFVVLHYIDILLK